MKVVITHLKAPWPAGAIVGSVVEVAAESLPGCFVGKCVPAEDDAEATQLWEPLPLIEAAAPQQAAAPAVDPDELRAVQALLEAERQASAELAGMVEGLRGQVADLTAQRDQALADLEAAKAAAQAPAAGGAETPAKTPKASRS